MKRIIDFKSVDMTEEEYDYYKKLVAEFTVGNYDGKNQFKNIFEVDGDGCLTQVQLPLKKKVSWAVIFFLQNLMINQRLRRMEKWVKEQNNNEQ